MIKIKNNLEIEAMRAACKITAEARELAGSLVRPGVTLNEIDAAVRKFIEENGAKPSFLNYAGFPKSTCLSVNEEIVHGIPSDRVLKEGDIVSVDVGAYYRGFHGDCAATYPVGKISLAAQKLIDVTKQSFFDGIADVMPGMRIGDISNRIQTSVESNGFSVVRDYIGHGVGEKLHEDPDVPNYGKPGRGPRLYQGMTIAIEPMVCEFEPDVKILSNDWTAVTRDGGLAAHYENTVLVTENGLVILTQV